MLVIPGIIPVSQISGKYFTIENIQKHKSPYLRGFVSFTEHSSTLEN